MKYRYTAAEKVIVWLDGFREITYGQKRKILSFLSEPTELVKNFATYTDILLSILKKEQYEEMEKSLQSGDPLSAILNGLEERGTFFVTPWSEDYPALLKETPAPPLVLYCKGNRALLKTRCLGAVGSRKTLPWAQSLAGEIAAKLSKKFTIVTGLAEGGDRAIIEGVLHGEGDGDGRVNLISVLAHGMDYVYPAAHDSLVKEIARRGLVVSEYPPAVQPQKYYFPVRNRLIAGMGIGVLVVSAGMHSGTSVTAGYAAEYGRDVFAFPYSPNVPSGAGCNNLIQSGAMLVTGAEDIFSVYGIEIKEEEKSISLQGEEKEIYDFIAAQDGAHVEEIAAHCGKPSYALCGALSSLEVKGFLVRMGGNRYAAAKGKAKE